MKSACQLKYQNICFIKGLKEVYCCLVLKDRRIAIGNEYLKIYDGKSFNFDFEISLKKHLGKNDKTNFRFEKLIYLKNGDILITNHGIYFIIKILDKEKKYFILDNLNLIESLAAGLLESVKYQITNLELLEIMANMATMATMAELPLFRKISN